MYSPQTANAPLTGTNVSVESPYAITASDDPTHSAFCEFTAPTMSPRTSTNTVEPAGTSIGEPESGISCAVIEGSNVSSGDQYSRLGGLGHGATANE